MAQPRLPLCSNYASSHDSRWPSGRYVAEAEVEDEHEKPSDKAEPVAAPKDSKVVEQLTQDGMFTPEGPLPGRDEELDFMQHALGIEGNGIL